MKKILLVYALSLPTIQLWCAAPDINAKITDFSKSPTWRAIDAMNYNNTEDFVKILKKNPDIADTKLTESSHSPLEHALFYYVIGENNHLAFYAEHLLKSNPFVSETSVDDIVNSITATLCVDSFPPKTADSRFQAFETIVNLFTNLSVFMHEDSPSQVAQSKLAQNELKHKIKKMEDNPLFYFGKESITQLNHENLLRLHKILQLEVPAELSTQDM